MDVGIRDQHLGSGDLSYLYDVPGVKLSLHNVANLMMMVSDNSGADICLTRAGVNNVNALMASLGAGDLHVDRPTQELILDYDYFVFTARQGAHSAPARERSGARGPRERPSRGVGQSPT